MSPPNSEPVAVPHVEHGTRALERLLLDEVLVRAREVEVLRDAVGPVDAHHIRLESAVEADERRGVGHGVDLEEVSGADLDARADPEAVVLAAPVPEPGEVEPQIMVRVAAVVAQQARAAIASEDDEVGVAILVVVEGMNGPEREREVGEELGGGPEAPLPLVAEQPQSGLGAGARGRGRARDREVQPAIVVEVDEEHISRDEAVQRQRRGERERVGDGAVQQADAVGSGGRDVQPAVAVHVADRDGLRIRGRGDAGAAGRRPGEAVGPLAEGAPALVVEEPQAARALGEDDVEIPVVVEIREGRVPCIGIRGSREAEVGRHLREAQVAVVAKEAVRAGPGLKHIQVPVLVEVRNEDIIRRAGRGARLRRQLDLAEATGGVVLIEARAGPGEPYIQPAVIVDVHPQGDGSALHGRGDRAEFVGGIDVAAEVDAKEAPFPRRGSTRDPRRRPRRSRRQRARRRAPFRRRAGDRRRAPRGRPDRRRGCSGAQRAQLPAPGCEARSGS